MYKILIYIVIYFHEINKINYNVDEKDGGEIK